MLPDSRVHMFTFSGAVLVEWGVVVLIFLHPTFPQNGDTLTALASLPMAFNNLTAATPQVSVNSSLTPNGQPQRNGICR